MSYEGYTEYLCPKGHLFGVNCYEDDGGPECCPRCKLPPVWSHPVDCTNGEVELEDGSIDPSTKPFPLEIDHYEAEIVQVPIYKIPKANKS